MKRSQSIAKPLASPVGQYNPEVLFLAPESGEDGNTLSLVSQLMELGIAFELDDHWRLPTAPPSDLSAYKACLFPETAKAEYDRDLDAFQRSGGFLPYFKYYPIDPSGVFAVDHNVNHYQYHGRDIFCFDMANILLQGGVTPTNPEFVRVLEARPHASILADVKAEFFRRFADRPGKPWKEWKDPDVLFLTNNLLSAPLAGDTEWLNLVRGCLRSVADSSSVLLDPKNQIQSQIPGHVEIYVLMFGALLMFAARRLGDASLTAPGVALGKHWFEHNRHAESAGSVCSKDVIGGEEPYVMPGLYALARETGDEAPAKYADRVFERTMKACLRDDGLWAHWADSKGNRHSAWGRATFWMLFGTTMSLYEIESGSDRARRILGHIQRSYDALAKHQDPKTGLWRNVIDEPFTRIESSGTAGIVFCYDRLRELGLADPKHEAMIEHAFFGVKRLCYRYGVGAFCRGTTYGGADYYRSRPLGFSPSSSMFAATVAARIS